jgi:hypothetical protein
MMRFTTSAIGLIVIFTAFLISGQTAFADPNLVGWWRFDEGTGTTAYDSANHNDGTLIGNLQWADGRVGGAIDSNSTGDYVRIPDSDSLTPSKTIALWVYIREGTAGIYKYADCPDQTGKGSPGNSRAYAFSVSSAGAGLLVCQTRDAMDSIISIGTISLNEWHHIAATFNNGQAVIYIDGQLNNTKTLSVTSIMNDAQPLTIGGYWEYCTPSFYDRLNGRIDDVRIYNRALTPTEITLLYDVKNAYGPNPYDGATDVNLNATLSWWPGVSAATHDVYLGIDYNDVNDADTSSDVYMGNYDINSFIPPAFEMSTNYYWRIDEINEPNIWKGNVWSFETGGPKIVLSAAEFEFSAIEGGENPDSQVLGISNSGIGTLSWTIDYDCNWLTVEPNSGSSTGDVCNVNMSVNINGLGQGLYNCSLTVSDSNALNSPQTVNVVLCVGNYVVVPNILNMTMTDANNALTTAGFSPPFGITYESNATYAANLVCRQDTACVVPCTTTINYVVSLGNLPNPPASITVPLNDADGAYTVSWTAPVGGGAPTSYQLESSAAGSGTLIYPLWVQIYSGTALSYGEKVGGGLWSYRVKATNAYGSSAYTTGGNTCTVAECLKTTPTGYADWVKWRYPACWCFRRQCRGDTDGRKAGTWVSATPDLANFKAAYSKTDAQLAALPCTWNATTGRICAICCDSTHSKAGTRVSANPDLATFKRYYAKPDVNVPCCDTAVPAGDCTLVAGDPYNFWTN